ncbi:lanthionine synthetase C family protein [Listeria monocytogenes]|nr:lanthionine synthetase C family protein [Listeria monocytogenes]EII2166244.1 lanthionine synthetase C family protein [Listeria monocytogenes]EII2287562.1 lanthionine synthetase C family protein [Listeria monocytogenes]
MKQQKDELIKMCKQIANTLKNPDEVKKIVTANTNISILGGTPWEDTTFSAGYPSLVVLFSELDNWFPDEGWDEISHKYLLSLQNSMISSGFYQNISLFSGLTGIAFSIRIASKNETRYTEFLENIDQMIITMVDQYCDDLMNKKNEGISPLWVDVISGLSGAGRYLLQVDNQASSQVQKKIEKCLILMGNSIEINNRNVVGWYVPNEFLFTDNDKEQFPNGVFNLGMAHGVAGLISYLSLSLIKNSDDGEKKETIEFMCDWLINKSEYRDYGLCWPSMIAFEEEINSVTLTSKDTRDAWCYGSAGIGRAIFLAGKATAREDYFDKSKEAFQAIYDRTWDEWRLEGPSFCHGYSGLLQIINRMYSDTNDEVYFSFKENLLELILEKYSEIHPFGFVDEEGTNKVTKIGIIDGVPGILLTLLSTIESQYPVITWDYPFLLA